jgi:hypothetical protein
MGCDDMHIHALTVRLAVKEMVHGKCLISSESSERWILKIICFRVKCLLQVVDMLTFGKAPLHAENTGFTEDLR